MVEAIGVCVDHVLRLVDPAEQTGCLIDSEFTDVNVFCFCSQWMTLCKKKKTREMARMFWQRHSWFCFIDK